jgi:predicted permease
MRTLTRLRLALRGVFRRSRLEQDLTDELTDWTEELAERHRARGASPDDALRRARAEVGGVVPLKAAVLDQRPLASWDGLSSDVKDAWRGLRRAPAFSIAVTLTLALGIGASTAIFSVVHTMLLAPLPYRDASRLVFIWSDMTSGGYPRAPLSSPELADLRERAKRFDGFGAIWATSSTLTEGEPEQLRTGLVTTNFFSVLGVDAALGRTFGPEDEAPPGGGIVLSWALFQRRFGGDTSIVGRRIQMNGSPQTVLGVMPATFRLLLPVDASVPDDLQAWTMTRSSALPRGPRGQQFLRVVGRMKPGVALGEARADIDRVATDISRQFAEYGAEGRQFRTIGLQDDAVREIRPSLIVLFVGVAVLAAIACVNVASLLVARAADRARDTALRAALGAGRGRLVRHRAAEALLLAGGGTAVGVAFAQGALAALLALRPIGLNRLAATRIDLAAVAFAVGVSLLSATLFSLAPVFEALRVNLTDALKSGDRRAMGSVPHRRTRQGLVFVQVALGVVLVVGAALLTRSVIAMQRADLGFESDHTLTFRMAALGARYRSPAAASDLSRRVLTALTSLPGVTGAGAISNVPFDNTPNWGGPFLTQPGQDEATAAVADYRSVTPGFFEAAGVRLVEGRRFQETDDTNTGPVVVVDDLLAKRAWPGQSAVGRTLLVDPGSSGHAKTTASVVGVVGHLRLRSVTATQSEEVFFSERQVVRSPIAYAVRTSGDPTALVSDVRRAMTAIDPLLPIADVRTLDAYTREATAASRFTATLAAVFAVVALALACVGIYGVVAYGVARRTAEFAVRLVLGARPGQIIAMAVGEGARLTLAGVVVGLAGAFAAARALRSQLFGVTPTDPLAFGLAALALGVAALGSCWLPARRAARSTPASALRGE